MQKEYLSIYCQIIVVFRIISFNFLYIFLLRSARTRAHTYYTTSGQKFETNCKIEKWEKKKWFITVRYSSDISSLFLNCCVRLCVFACRSPLRLLCKCTGLLCNMYTKQNKKKVNGYIVRSVMAFFLFLFFCLFSVFRLVNQFFFYKKKMKYSLWSRWRRGDGRYWLDWLVNFCFAFF